MADLSRREYLLEGLSCTRCSAEIEEQLAKLTGIGAASVKLLEKTLTVDLEGQDIEPVLEQARAVISRIEPEIVIREKHLDQEGRRILMVMGLCCEDCGVKIAESIRQIPGVRDARLDARRSELLLDLEQTAQPREILAPLRQRARAIVKGIRIRDDEIRRRNLTRLKYILMGMGALLFGAAIIVPDISLAFFIASYLCFGWDVVWKAGSNLFRGRVFDENLLMSIATAGAFAIGQFPEAVTVMLFYKIGSTLEERAVNRSRKSIKSVLDLRPEWAFKRDEGRLVRVRPREVAVGDLLVVKPGERVPLDGVVTEGDAFVDARALTGESVPIHRTHGDRVSSGAIVQNSPLVLRVEKSYADSNVSKIIAYVEAAGAKKSRTEHFLTAFTRVYTPLVVGLAFLIAFLPPLVLAQDFNAWLYRGLIFLVISCPCALVLSIPLSFSAGIGRLARSGILVKGSQYIETLTRAGTVIFDKTGTLTEGNFEVTSIRPANGFSQEQVLSFAALADAYSDHPVSRALRNRYNQPIDLTRVVDFNEIAGRGVRAQVDGQAILVGNAKFLAGEGIRTDEPTVAGTIVHVAHDRVYAGYVLISDQIRAGAAPALTALAGLGITTMAMLSGDREEYARSVGETLGLSEIHAELLPEEKVLQFDIIREREKKNGSVICVGDGINDAPLLAHADLGVAMGGLGRDAAVEVADMVLLNDDLGKLPLAVRIARATHRIVIQNVILAFGVKALVLVLGTIGLATLWEAVFADVGVALLALVNALRILRK